MPWLMQSLTWGRGRRRLTPAVEGQLVLLAVAEVGGLARCPPPVQQLMPELRERSRRYPQGQLEQPMPELREQLRKRPQGQQVRPKQPPAERVALWP